MNVAIPKNIITSACFGCSATFCHCGHFLFKSCVMITKEVFNDILYEASIKETADCLNKPQDYVSIVLHIFNIGSYATFESVDYNEEAKTEHLENGNCYYEKTEFLKLLMEFDFKKYTEVVKLIIT